ncbi:MAG: leucine-rich repeat domain-containing protein [Lachnospiraceae bacterium]|nr:leucine-rich repeat domain-containing protein [Lachnospiraceae bacterium]
MIEKDFETLLFAYPDALSDRGRFAGLVKDYFPGQLMQINLILSAYDLGIAEDLQKTVQINNTFAYRYVKRLMDEYGISRVNADWVVSLWCVCYGQHMLKKPCDIKLASKGGSHVPAIQEEKPGVVTYGDLFRYARSSIGNGLAVSGFTGESKKTIIFQNRSGGKSVVEVQSGAFSECEIEEAIFTEGFVQIGERAFSGCSRLSQVIFPISMKELGDYAFAGCCSLSMAALPPALEKIGAYSLSHTNLKNIDIPASLYWLGEGALSGCKNLTKVVIPDNITELPDKMFSDCTALTKVTLNEKMDRIGARAFDGCENLEEIYIPDSIQQIGDGAFDNMHDKFILMCSFGSYAESYARKNKLKYELI